MGSNLVNVALIPARGGSERVPGKNLKLLNNIPLVAHSIKSALKSNMFSEVIVSTDDPDIAQVGREYGAGVPNLRPKHLATSTSTDIEWLMHSIRSQISTPLTEINFLAILRPTSPLRSSETICRAISYLTRNPWADSLRAMEVTEKHPGKMWILDSKGKAKPYLNQSHEKVPTYNRPLQTLPVLWVQNASLEIVRLEAVLRTKTISGENVLAFEMPGLEGFDINSLKDMEYLDYLVRKNPSLLNN